MKYQNKSYRNIGILTLVFAFMSLGFVGNTGSAQIKKNAKAIPTPKSKAKTTLTTKKATPTPTKAKSNQKTTAKIKPTPTPNKNTKSKTTAATDKSSKTKTSSNNKTSSTSKSAKTTDKKSLTTTKKTQTASTKTTTKNTKPAVQKTRTQTPVKQTKTTTVQPNKELPQIVVSSLSTSVRNAPNLTASEVSRAKLGSVYKVVEKNTGWYKVQISNRGTTSAGWIPVTAATNLETGGNDEIYRQILTRNYKSEKMNFAEAVEVYEFLTRVQPEIKNETAAADFGLKRLMALRAALDAIPFGQKDQKIYQDFLKAQDQNIVYSEPAGEYYVRAPIFWDLHSKYTNLPVAGEKIAWEATKNPLPGECEGYVNCYLFLLRMTDAEYLNFYPSGGHATEALTNIIKLLDPIAADVNSKTIYNGPSDVSDRAEFNSLITELRVIISRLPNTEKEKALQQLKKIAEGFK